MEKKLKISIQMIKVLKIKNKNDYIKLLDYYDLLSIESLKYITGERNSKEVFKKLREV